MTRTVSEKNTQMVRDFAANLPTRTGYVLNDDAKAKFFLFVSAQMIYRKIVVTPDALLRCFEWLVTAPCCFAEGTYGYSPEAKTSEPVTEPAPKTLDDVLATTSTDSLIARRAVHDAWVASFVPILTRWSQHLREDHGVTVSDSDFDYLFAPHVGVFAQNNWPITVDKLNAARRLMSYEGRWPGALSCREWLNSQLSTGAIDRSTYMHKVNRLTHLKKIDRPLREAKDII
ncbi:MAG TPA: hypothetical protein VJP02_17875 [Candidatus Sulfotelmatobacter sp.]|nr:hypothetical protein [Candidatus Sulfotelmatobacter sp.]